MQRLLDVMPLLTFYPHVHVIRHSLVAYITMDTVNRLFPVTVTKGRQPLFLLNTYFWTQRCTTPCFSVKFAAICLPLRWSSHLQASMLFLPRQQEMKHKGVGRNSWHPSGPIPAATTALPIAYQARGDVFPCCNFQPEKKKKVRPAAGVHDRQETPR